MGASLGATVQASAPGKVIAAKGDIGVGYLSVGTVLGGFGAFATFVVVWLLAADAGVLGILFGWIPAGIAATIVFWLVAFLWAPLILMGFIVYGSVSKHQDVPSLPISQVAAPLEAPATYATASPSDTAAAAAPTPSFDCRKAKGITASAICADAELSDLDQKMGAAYSARIALDPSVKPRQRAWLAARDIGCESDRGCLKAFITARTPALDARGVSPFPTTPVAMPTAPGDCLNTSVVSVAARNPDYPAGGSTVTYASGGQQVSSTISNLSMVSAGDSVIVCLVTVPEGCPSNDHRGTIYSGADLVSGLAWREPDSDKTCGAA